ncbi:MAG: class I SAM-dependent methyltransferase [Candidatus Dormibacteraeota bacterium]|nr:class I SAM-dependent methyltransferase [Candidatus Dormibacteraeota bacterium]
MVQPPRPEDRVRAYYASRGEQEWDRLSAPDDGAVEEALHRRAFAQYLPSGVRILDIGGGPGRWTVWLAERGHQLVLADLTPSLLEIARRKIAEARVQRLVEDVVEADARDLSRWDDGSFGAVLALGPFYHLPIAGDRERALAEVRRVLEPNGLLFATVMPRYPRAFFYAWERGTPGIELARSIVETGTFQQDQPGRFTDGYHFKPAEVRPFFESGGFQTLRLMASQGFLFALQPLVSELGERDPEARDQLLDLAYKTADDPSIFGFTGHLMFIGRKESG